MEGWHALTTGLGHLRLLDHRSKHPPPADVSFAYSPRVATNVLQPSLSSHKYALQKREFRLLREHLLEFESLREQEHAEYCVLTEAWGTVQLEARLRAQLQDHEGMVWQMLVTHCTGIGRGHTTPIQCGSHRPVPMVHL